MNILYPHETNVIHEQTCGCAWRKFRGETTEHDYAEEWERFEICSAHLRITAPSVTRIPGRLAAK